MGLDFRRSRNKLKHEENQMLNTLKNRFRRTNLSLMVLGALACFSIVVVAGGCSTVSGFASLVEGVAADLSDAAEGSRNMMSRNNGD